MYSGDNCEIESQSLNQIKQIISAASIIAMVTIVVSYSLIALNDLHTILTTPGKFLPRLIKKKKLKKDDLIHFEYIP